MLFPVNKTHLAVYISVIECLPIFSLIHPFKQSFTHTELPNMQHDCVRALPIKNLFAILY